MRAHLTLGAPVPNLVQSAAPGKKLPVSFYKSGAGSEPVRDWLKSLLREECIIIGGDIKAVEMGWPVGLPLCRSLGNGLWEVRSDLPTRIARVIFFVHESHMVLLHGFIKKQQKTPQSDIELALTRKRQVENAR
jgi:phage-related protein